VTPDCGGVVARGRHAPTRCAAPPVGTTVPVMPPPPNTRMLTCGAGASISIRVSIDGRTLRLVCAEGLTIVPTHRRSGLEFGSDVSARRAMA
jgi:hypothetical protein